MLPSSPSDIRRETELGRYQLWSKTPVRVFANCRFGRRDPNTPYLWRLRGRTPLSVSCGELAGKVRQDKSLSSGRRGAILRDLGGRGSVHQTSGEAYRFAAKLMGRIYKGMLTRREPLFSETAGRRFDCNHPEASIVIRQLGMVNVTLPSGRKAELQGQAATGLIRSYRRDSADGVELDATAKGRSPREIASASSSYTCADGTERSLHSGPLAPETWKPLDGGLDRIDGGRWTVDGGRFEEELGFRHLPGRLGRPLIGDRLLVEPEVPSGQRTLPITDPAPGEITREFFYDIRFIPCRGGGKAAKPKRC